MAIEIDWIMNWRLFSAGRLSWSSVFSSRVFDLKMWSYFPGVCKTHNKKVVKETLKRQILEITRRRDRKEEDEEEIVFTEMNDDGVGDDDEGGVRL